jgi:nitrite reductase/ring-hydroxylating ferredoxin subunit
MSALRDWLKRRRARAAKRAGDAWVCPYCREVHPRFEVGGTKFGFGFPSVKFACCGRVAFMLKDAKTGQLMSFTRIGDGHADWMPQEAYFAWYQSRNVARGAREDSVHREKFERGELTPAQRKPGAQAAAELAPQPPAPEPAPAAAPAPPAATEAPPEPAPSVFVAVAKVGDLAPGQSRVVDVNGKRVALFRVGEGFHAIDDTCAHAGRSLGEGALEDGIVTCNGHGWRYDVRTGVSENRPDVAVRAYQVKVEGDSILIGA